MRIAIVNDLRIAREALRRLVVAADDCEVIWEAESGEEAVERCREDRPDLLLLDLLMPGMDGVEATRRIMAETPCPIVIVTATVDGQYARVYEALGAGALDAVDTPRLGVDGGIEDVEPLLRRIRTVRRLQASPAVDAAPPETRDVVSPAPDAPAVGSGPRIVAVAASTGGPDALVRLLTGLPAELPHPIVVVQHLGAAFLEGFVQWLAHQTARDVRAVEADAAVLPRPGEVWVAAGRDHLVARPDGRLALQTEPADAVHRPSADVFFESLADWSRPGVAVVLTGMGRDGARGVARLRRSGWATLAQDRETSVVYGMPRAAAESGAVEAVHAIDELGGAILRALEQLEAPSSGGVVS